MISSKFFIINQGMELGDKTPLSPLMRAKPSLVSPLSFSLLLFFFFLFFFFLSLFFSVLIYRGWLMTPFLFTLQSLRGK